MAIAFVQKSTLKESTSGATSFDLNSLGSATTAGNLLVVCVQMYASTAGAISITDSKGNTFTKHVEYNNNANNGRIVIASTIIESGKAGSSHYVTLGHGTNGWFVGQIVEFSGIAASSYVDQTDTATPSTAINEMTVVSGTLAQADELVVALLGCVGGDTAGNLSDPASSGYTSIGVNQNYSAYAGGYQASYKIVSATTAVSASWTGDAASSTACSGLVTFKAGSTTTKKLKLLVHPSAASETGVEGVVLNAARDTVIGEFSGQAFEAALVGSPGQAVLLIDVADITPDGSTLTTSDEPIVFAYNSTNGTVGEGIATVIEE